MRYIVVIMPLAAHALFYWCFVYFVANICACFICEGLLTFEFQVLFPLPLQLTPLYLCKLSNVLSGQAFQVHMQSFMKSKEKTVMVLVSRFQWCWIRWNYIQKEFLHYITFLCYQVINMQETTKQMVNHVRIMMEQAEGSVMGMQVCV